MKSRWWLFFARQCTCLIHFCVQELLWIWKSLTHSTLLQGWSCAWRMIFWWGWICWHLWGKCSSGCSSCCHRWAMAAHLSLRNTGSGATRRWWHCSRSQHTGQWQSQCSPHLTNKDIGHSHCALLHVFLKVCTNWSCIPTHSVLLGTKPSVIYR